MSRVSPERAFPGLNRPAAHLELGRGLDSAWAPTPSVLITRPYHRAASELALTAGPATDLRGYEPNETLSDGMASDKLSQSPPGEHCHSHTLHLTLQLLPFILLSGICL